MHRTPTAIYFPPSSRMFLKGSHLSFLWSFGFFKSTSFNRAFAPLEASFPRLQFHGARIAAAQSLVSPHASARASGEKEPWSNGGNRSYNVGTPEVNLSGAGEAGTATKGWTRCTIWVLNGLVGEVKRKQIAIRAWTCSAHAPLRSAKALRIYLKLKSLCDCRCRSLQRPIS
jgi:hypothetical protein